jgi:hypothetical protein
MGIWAWNLSSVFFLSLVRAIMVVINITYSSRHTARNTANDFYMQQKE